MSERLGPEQILNPEEGKSEFEVLSHLYSTSGEQIAPRILNSLLYGDETTLIVEGRPGSGKTTVVSQVIRALSEITQGNDLPISLYHSSYEKVLLNDVRDFTSHYDYWSRELWTVFNRDVVQDFLHPSEDEVINISGRHGKLVKVLELPAVGKIDARDRGVSAQREIAALAPDAIHLYLIGHAQSEARALDLRSAVLRANDEDVVGEMLKRHVIPVGFSGIRRDGIIIKAMFNGHADEKHLRAIKAECQEQWRIWLVYSAGIPRAIESVGRYFPEIELPNSFRIRIEDGKVINRYEREQAVSEAVYMQGRFNELGLSEEHGVVAFSDFVEEGDVHFYAQGIKPPLHEYFGRGETQ